MAIPYQLKENEHLIVTPVADNQVQALTTREVWLIGRWIIHTVFEAAKINRVDERALYAVIKTIQHLINIIVNWIFLRHNLHPINHRNYVEEGTCKMPISPANHKMKGDGRIAILGDKMNIICIWNRISRSSSETVFLFTCHGFDDNDWVALWQAFVTYLWSIPSNKTSAHRLKELISNISCYGTRRCWQSQQKLKSKWPHNNSNESVEYMKQDEERQRG